MTKHTFEMELYIIKKKSNTGIGHNHEMSLSQANPVQYSLAIVGVF